MQEYFAVHFNAPQAAFIFRDTIRAYCFQMSGLDVLVPLSVETTVDIDDVKLPKTEELMGVYLN